MSAETLLELQQQRDALKSNIQDVNENIKKLTGRDPTESRRLSTSSRRIQLKRNSFGRPDSNHTPVKRANTERRRWGNTALTSSNLDSGGEETEEKKPVVHSSVVATGKPIESLQKTVVEDRTTKNRNKRMFGLLVGTLKQFKKESQVKSVQEVKQEEKLTKVEEQVQKEKEEALIERKELYQTRRTKQQELQKLEFKVEMEELSISLKEHYQMFQGLIQLKSTPRVFYKPAVHNEKTTKLVEDTKESVKESLHQRLKEIEMCTEEDIRSASRSFTHQGHGKSAKDSILIDPIQSKRDLFAEEADNDQREQQSIEEKEDKKVSVMKSPEIKVPESQVKDSSAHLDDEQEVSIVGEVDHCGEDDSFSINGVQDERRVISDASYNVVDERYADERVVEISIESKTDDFKQSKSSESLTAASAVDDDVNIYEDVQPDIDLFQADDSGLM